MGRQRSERGRTCVEGAEQLLLQDRMQQPPVCVPACTAALHHLVPMPRVCQRGSECRPALAWDASWGATMAVTRSPRLGEQHERGDLDGLGEEDRPETEEPGEGDEDENEDGTSSSEGETEGWGGRRGGKNAAYAYHDDP
jgi:hypothetical protein